MSTKTSQSQRPHRPGPGEYDGTGSSPGTPEPLDLAATAHSTSFANLTRHRGPGADIVDFCIPCNPYFPTPTMFAQLAADLPEVLKYYPSDSSLTTKKLASILGLNPQTVAMANGSTELITWIDHLLVRESLAIPIPTFGRWTDQPLETGKRVDMFPLQEKDGFALDLDEYAQFIRRRGSRVAVICNPNNPDGGYLPKDEVVRFLDELADLDLVIVDESFIDFVDVEPRGSVADQAAIRPNVIVLKSLGKNFGLHGIRFGYMVANPALTATVAGALPKWNLNALAETVVHMIEDHWDDYEHSLRLLGRDRDHMRDQLHHIAGLTVYPSTANFVMVKVPAGWSGTDLRDHLLTHHDVFVRECGNKLGMTSDFLRLVVRPADDVARLIRGLQDYEHRQHSERAA